MLLFLLYRTLVTFDIDGTLLNKVNNGQKIPVKRWILKELFNIDEEPSKILGYSTVGYTDIYIAEEIIKKVTKKDKAPEDLMDRYFQLYVQYYKEYYNDSKYLSKIAGVEKFLSKINKMDDVYLGLVTGNNKFVGEMKMNLSNLTKYFDKNLLRFGTHRDRKDIINSIVDKAKRMYGNIDRVIHVGDAEQDIEAADEAGVESLLVKTGPQSNKPMSRKATITVDNFVKDYKKAIDFIIKGKSKQRNKKWYTESL